MTRAAVLLAACCALVPLCGCGLLSDEQQDAVQALVLAKLDEAWAEKGAEAVADKVDELVADGKITHEQGEVLKAAAQQGYETLRTKAEKMMGAGIDNEQP